MLPTDDEEEALSLLLVDLGFFCETTLLFFSRGESSTEDLLLVGTEWELEDGSGGKDVSIPSEDDPAWWKEFSQTLIHNLNMLHYSICKANIRESTRFGKHNSTLPVMISKHTQYRLLEDEQYRA